MMKIEIASREAVNYACKMFHYSKSVPPFTIAYAVFEEDERCGVITFGYGANRNIATEFGLIQGQVAELTRVALNGKQHKTSQCVAAAMKRLKEDCPLLKIVVSYADMEQNHRGIIYQAMSRLYLGEIAARTQIILHGKKTHERTVFGKYKTQKISEIKEFDPEASIVKGKVKHKYVFVFDRKLRKKILSDVKPYPKQSAGQQEQDIRDMG